MYRTINRTMPLPARIMFTTDGDDGGGGDTGDTTQGTGDGEGAGDSLSDADLEYKLEAATKVNRDLERKLKEALKRGDRVTELEAELAKAQGREAEFAEIQKQREVEAAALAKANQRILSAEVKAAAAGKLNDATDALRLLDLSSFEVGDDGEVDHDAIAAAIDDLIKAKPYLAAQGGTGTVFESPGGRRKGTPGGQLTKADLSNMTPEQISAARAEGRLNDLLGIQN